MKVNKLQLIFNRAVLCRSQRFVCSVKVENGLTSRHINSLNLTSNKRRTGRPVFNSEVVLKTEWQLYWTSAHQHFTPSAPCCQNCNPHRLQDANSCLVLGIQYDIQGKRVKFAVIFFKETYSYITILAHKDNMCPRSSYWVLKTIYLSACMSVYNRPTSLPFHHQGPDDGGWCMQVSVSIY